jgi:hypothetical protein
VNQPLPLKWDIKFDDYAKISKQVLFTLKIIDALAQRTNLNQMEKKYIKEINEFIKNLTNKTAGYFATEIDIEKD